MKVENMTSSKGNSIPNQFIISDEINNECYFQSYETTIIKNDCKGQIWLDEKYWDYSMTTGKYRNSFLGETKKETLKKIETGVYKLTDLNRKAVA